MSAARVAVGANSCLESSWRISHLGINPVIGGRPARERSTRGVRATSAGAFAQEMANILMLVALASFKVRNVAVAAAMYTKTARVVREGANCRTSTIQPS